MHMLSSSEPPRHGAATKLLGAMSSVPLSRADRDATVALGKRIAALRKKRNITQVELSKSLGVAQPLISSYEIGRSRPPHEFLKRLAEVLDVSTDEIFGLQAREPKGEDLRVERRFAKRLKLVRALPKRDQDALLRTIDAFLTARDAR